MGIEWKFERTRISLRGRLWYRSARWGSWKQLWDELDEDPVWTQEEQWCFVSEAAVELEPDFA